MSRDRSKEVEACDEFVENAYQGYNLETVADLLLSAGLLIDGTAQYVGTFEKYVFLNGNQNEVYTKPEINFVDEVGEVIIFQDYYKKTKKSIVPCRVMAARIDYLDIVSAGIAFTKIANKATDGMNICLAISEEGMLFTGRVFSQSGENECFISEVIKDEEQYEAFASEMIFASEYEDFIEYYSYVKSVIHYEEEQDSYTDKLKSVHRVPYAYIEKLEELEKTFNVSFSREIERAFLGYQGENELSYSDRVNESEECLFSIESSKVNTIEMLFEAEEIERLATEAEIKNSEMLQQNNPDHEESKEADAEMQELLNDPESMIKMLKKKRGI